MFPTSPALRPLALRTLRSCCINSAPIEGRSGWSCTHLRCISAILAVPRKYMLSTSSATARRERIRSKDHRILATTWPAAHSLTLPVFPYCVEGTDHYCADMCGGIILLYLICSSQPTASLPLMVQKTLPPEPDFYSSIPLDKLSQVNGLRKYNWLT